ncbi:peptide chain release factor N(5)-glutamine methyltransferase [Gordonia sp. ABSL1-1]|uniref:peptide chain release factor N(5)-glutamine methyltransferase n=1 Tax=Gordonia sp. ABSL1-1 TaxID=3053923 RepID=UPI0025736391|nr:peptide chain release factor N(5)-glutamine methyltransferase [Gordonia sp. ABSL1-1]MDL9937036.1 peptide chain release factor N(5)-glutamine methyltransferase [Gordonia sp. ABSL1-1]
MNTGRPAGEDDLVVLLDATRTPTPVAAARVASAFLAAHGIESPRADADWLIAHVLGVSPGRLLLIDELTAAQRSALVQALTCRAQRIPLQHITGRAAFGPLELAVGPGVFIPRPETEWLLEWAVAQANSVPTGAAPQVVDLCSGSGALAVGVATLVPDAQVVAVELDTDALTWLRHNVEESPAADRVSVVAADVTDATAMNAVLPAAGVDVIVTNPPYVPRTAMVSAEVGHDPDRAIFGGDDGMSVIVPMLTVVAAALVPSGVVGIEHDDTTSAEVVAALSAHGAFIDVAAHRDLAGRDRFVTARRRPWSPTRRERMGP